MEFLDLTLELFRNADQFIIHIASQYGIWIYIVLFSIFFAETGIVICAFLPGDSLLFVAGAAAATGVMHPVILIAVITLGAIIGNTTNYYIGKWLGNKIYDGSFSWIDQDALNKTHAFYAKHGGKTIILARFVPIVRSFAPLVAGAARMDALRFELYSGFGRFALGCIHCGCRLSFRQHSLYQRESLTDPYRRYSCGTRTIYHCHDRPILQEMETKENFLRSHYKKAGI